MDPRRRHQCRPAHPAQPDPGLLLMLVSPKHLTLQQRSAAPQGCEASTHEVQTKAENPKNLFCRDFQLDKADLSRRI